MFSTTLSTLIDAVSKHYLDSKWWNGEPVWITNQKAFKKIAVVFWPGSEVKIEGQYPTHYLPYNRSLSFEKRIDYLCTMLEQDDPPSFNFWPLILTSQITVGINLALIHQRLKTLFVEWIMSLDICWKVYEIEDC